MIVRVAAALEPESAAVLQYKKPGERPNFDLSRTREEHEALFRFSHRSVGAEHAHVCTDCVRRRLVQPGVSRNRESYVAA